MYPFSFSKQTAAFVFAAALALFCAGVWTIVYAETSRSSGALTLAFLDVGQGDALYIESPTGVQVLVDAGPDESVLRSLADVMPPLDRSLDAVIATHPDADHIGGFSSLLERYDVGAYLMPGIYKDTATARALEAAVDEYGVPRIVARRGMTLDLGDGAVLEVLYPDFDASVLPGEKANEGGIVARVRYKESKALLMADVGKGVEARLATLESVALRSEVLKVGHHGSKYSSGEAFVALAAPDVAVISVGKNSYGHPTAQTLGVLERAGAQILRTDEEGTIRCVSDGVRFSCE